ncbi:hypothetical protein RchiOBHm_Chr1g0339541 [Rosa chinensis]|uniref:Uncharacterized protein n=1 Tax=Rosa chinensis TaxID=74649 RepID=A0A2P6SD86_ROSCH|nr:hypothetical protein RchiOBHm_Chr1g0339541 [Rosa chinensis]
MVRLLPTWWSSFVKSRSEEGESKGRSFMDFRRAFQIPAVSRPSTGGRSFLLTSWTSLWCRIVPTTKHE